jgi:hypothetical protein
VDAFINKTTAIPGGVYDRRPCAVDGFVKGTTSGFYFDKATGITIRNSSVKWGNNRPAYFSHTLESYSIGKLQTINLDGLAAFPEKVKAIKNSVK